MADSEWESIRKKFRNRVRYSFGIGIPVLLLAGFLFYNNRDLFSNSVQNETTVKRSDTTLFIKSLPDSNVGHEVDQYGRVSVTLRDSTVKKTDSAGLKMSPEIKKTAKKEAVEQTSGSSKPLVFDVPIAEAISGTSLVLPSIRCRTADQSGLFLNLSVELKTVNDSAIEKKILVMRDELRVLIQNVVRGKEISTLSQEPLKTEIIQSINKYLGEEVFNDLKFTEFNVEKVIKK
jgi:hypothetical protein